jgi:hypothetical protein
MILVPLSRNCTSKWAITSGAQILARRHWLDTRRCSPKAYSKHAYVVQLIMSALEKTGQQQEATAFALLYNHLSLDELRGNFCKFSEDEQLRLYQRSRKISDNIALNFAIRHPEYPELAAASYEFEMTIKGLSLANRRQLFQSLHNNADAALSAQFEEWQRLQNQISKQYALAPARRQTNVDSLLASANELERHLVANSEPFRLSNQLTHWQDVQAALSPGEAAIEFGRLKRNRSDSVLYAAWLIRPGDLAPQQVFLFEEKEVGNLAATLRLYAPEHSPAGKNLRELLWQPLETAIERNHHPLFCPGRHPTPNQLGRRARFRHRNPGRPLPAPPPGQYPADIGYKA